MKRFSVMLCLLTVLLAGCDAAGRQDPSATSDFPLRVTAILPHDDTLRGEENGYWASVASGITGTASERGMDAQVVTPQINYDAAQLASLIRQSTYARVDAIIAQGMDDPAYVAALRAAHEAGIQVVLVDTDADVGFEHLYIGTDNLEAGRSLGNFVREATGGRAEIAVLSGGEGYSNVEQRLAGLMEVIDAAADMRVRVVAYDNYDSLTVVSEYNRILREFPEVDTLVCIEGTAGQTLSQMLGPEQCPLDFIFAFDATMDTLGGLKNGLITGILAQNQEQMGSLAIEEIERYLCQGAYSSTAIYTQTQILSREGDNSDG